MQLIRKLNTSLTYLKTTTKTNKSKQNWLFFNFILAASTIYKTKVKTPLQTVVDQSLLPMHMNRWHKQTNVQSRFFCESETLKKTLKDTYMQSV